MYVMYKWESEFPEFKNVSYGSELWTNIFCAPFNTVRDTKLQTFQYKIIHRIVWENPI